ncbi:MAG: hypothetical protein S4CHLAM102_01990 [Chlamydiia bacterium]|nr:hypothetical protein [Chlamydiia bacterium]
MKEGLEVVMVNPFFNQPYDLMSPDGMIETIVPREGGVYEAVVVFDDIPHYFKGFDCGKEHVMFNLRSSVGQVGVTSRLLDLDLVKGRLMGKARVELVGLTEPGRALLGLLGTGARIAKLFAACPERLVRDPEYLTRMYGKHDRNGSPLLSFNMDGDHVEPRIERTDGHVIAYLPVLPEVYRYDPEKISSFLPTLALSLMKEGVSVRSLLGLLMEVDEGQPACPNASEMILLKTHRWQLKTMFARVADYCLEENVFHTTASLHQPDTDGCCDIYGIYGEGEDEVRTIPHEFFTLEYYRESVYFSDRKLLQELSINPNAIKAAFERAELQAGEVAATFLVKGEQLLNLRKTHWIRSLFDPNPNFPKPPISRHDIPIMDASIAQTPLYPILQAIEDDIITSQGILLSTHFPSPYMKRFLLSERVRSCLRAIYFLYPSHRYGKFFSHDDRAFLMDLSNNAIDIFWVMTDEDKLLQYTPKKGKDCGLFLPPTQIGQFYDTTLLGVYGSVAVEGNFEEDLQYILEGLLEMRNHVNHPQLYPDKPLGLVTGGGPGAMCLGNRVAKKVGILSCGNVCDFSSSSHKNINKEEPNPYLDGLMTYRLDKLIERQAEFNLDLPIILTGGIGTDFEYSLEEVRMNTGSTNPRPIILVGTKEYWKAKITHRFQQNIASKTIRNAEWISNCFYQVETAGQALAVYYAYFTNTLRLGPFYEPIQDGFYSTKELMESKTLHPYPFYHGN